MNWRSTFRWMAMVSALAAGTLTPASSALAAKRPGSNSPSSWLYSVEKSAKALASDALVLDAAEAFQIQVDPAAIAANPKGFLVEIPDSSPLEAVRAHFHVYRPDFKSWFGTLRHAGEEGPGTGSIYVGYHGNRITADIVFEGERYRIVGGPEEGQRLVRLANELSLPPCGLEPRDELLWREPAGGEHPSAAEESQAAKAGVFYKTTAQLDVLVVYPREMFTRLQSEEQALKDFADDSIAKANVAFQHSQVDASYNLVGVVPVLNTAQPTNGLYNSLQWLTGGVESTEPRNPEAAALRDAFGADIVSVFIPADWGASPAACGVANEPRLQNRFVRGNTTVLEPMGDRAFSAVRSDCGAIDYTLAHEIGHNYGLRHDNWANNASLDLFPEGRGYVFQVGTDWKATIMGCACGASPLPACGSEISAGVCNRIDYFSDPNILYMGVPTGVAPTQSDPGRLEASVLRQQVGGYAGFRAASSNTEPNVVLSVSCSGLTCSFSGNGTTDNTSIPSANYYWDFGDGGTTTGKNVSHAYASAGSKRVHLVVTDSGGQRTVKWSTAAPWNPIYEGFLEGSSCGVISGWAWDQVIPNTPISVDIYRDSTKVATVSANQFRQDLFNAGKGNGSHGFGYTPTSSWKDGQFHTPSVKFAGTNTNLTWSPGQPIFCDGSMFTGIPPGPAQSTGGVVYSVGTQFSSTRSGTITQIGFHRASGETGTNTLRLWTDGGTLLRSVTPTCSSSGWCWASISSHTINANTLYRVSVNTNTAQTKTNCGIGSGITNGPLTAHQGLWIAGDAFPTTGSCSNFFVDILFSTN